MSTTNRLDRCFRAIDEFRRNVAETPPDELDCVALEREAREHTEALGRELMRDVLARADTKAPQVTINGKVWGNRRETPGSYFSTFGEVDLPRSIYSQPGGGPVAVPLDLRLGIHEGRYTPQAARVVNRMAAVMTEEEAEGMLAEIGVAKLSKSTLHRLPRAICARYETMRVQIEEELRERDEVPDAAVAIQVALDGVMVPEDGENALPRGRPSETPNGPRHELRYPPVLGPGPAANDGAEGRAWHEASVGTVSFWNKDGEHIKTIYHGRMPESGMGTLADEIEDELRAAVARRPDLQVVFASDGDAHQWSLLEGMAVRLPETVEKEVWYLLDFFHAAEYIQLAANAAEGKDTPEAHVLAAKWREMLKEYKTGPERIIKAMRYHRDRQTSEARVKDLDTAITFFVNQTQNGRMAYAAAREKNLPIGTGVTEAAAKTVVGVRMCRAGIRFGQHGGQTVMVFRTALLSERFEDLSECLTATYTATVKEAA